MTTFSQIDESERAASLRPIGLIAIEPDSLATRYGLTFDADEHDGTTAAMVVLDTGEQYMLLRHLDAPVSGTEVLASELSSDPTGDLDHLLHALELPPEAVTWRLSHDEAVASARELSNGRAPARRTSAARGSRSRPKDGMAARSTAKRATTERSAAKRSTAKRTTTERSAVKRSTAKRATTERSAAKRSTAKRTTTERSAAKRSAGTRSTARHTSPARPSRSLRQASSRRSGSTDEARIDAIATRLRKLNDRIIEAGKDAGEATLSSYERALRAIAMTIERGSGSSDIEWVSKLATAQAKFIRDLARSSTKAARKALK